MDVLHLSVAVCPLAVYLLVIGMVGLSRRPLLTNGGRDVGALGLAISGLILVGPMELFFPEEAATEMGGAWFVWLLLLALYFLGLLLVVLLSRPRLVIYNLPFADAREALNSAADRLGTKSVWAGDSLMLPDLGVQLHVDAFGGMRSVQVIASGSRQNLHGWRRLEIALQSVVRERQGQRNPFGIVMMGMGLAMLLLVTFLIFRDPQTVAQSLREMLQ